MTEILVEVEEVKDLALETRKDLVVEQGCNLMYTRLSMYSVEVEVEIEVPDNKNS
jgi:hypothetical protein